jgi:hypothetical protein
MANVKTGQKETPAPQQKERYLSAAISPDCRSVAQDEVALVAAFLRLARLGGGPFVVGKSCGVAKAQDAFVVETINVMKRRRASTVAPIKTNLRIFVPHVPIARRARDLLQNVQRA